MGLPDPGMGAAVFQGVAFGVAVAVQALASRAFIFSMGQLGEMAVQFAFLRHLKQTYGVAFASAYEPVSESLSPEMPR